MNITYTGKTQEFTREEQKKLDARFARVAKLVERAGERKAHVVWKTTRHLKNAEITMNYYDRPLVSAGSNSDAFQALAEAVDKLEKQLLKVLEKGRSTARRDNGAKALKMNGAVIAAAATASEEEAEAVRVYRVKASRQKPMTLEEAMIHIGDSKDYLIYRDPDGAGEGLSVLIRRKDGHFDLVQP